MFIAWEKLDPKLKNKEVKFYYDILEKKKCALCIKRLFDILISLVMLALLLPIFLLLAILIKIDSKGPVFYRQERVTTNNKIFRIYKFRTMVQNTDKVGSLVTVKNDMRITNVGQKIRKSRLDEIPQLINILKGEMSFVGTRPEVRKYVDAYDKKMMATLLMPAGVTSLASIEYKDEDKIIDKEQKQDIDRVYIEKILPYKMEYNFKYIEKFNFFYDIKLMFKTFMSVIK